MKGRTKPNFSTAYSKANEILVKSNIMSSFPFLPVELVKEQSKIVCRTFEKALIKHGVDIAAFGSESAVIIQKGDKQIIFYDQNKPISHIKFSILHEFGHAVINHDFNKKDEEVYGCYEVETNYFAAQLLMPEQLIREFVRRGVKITKEFLIETFEVSPIAAQKRMDTLAKSNVEWRSRQEKEFDDIILMKFQTFLSKIQPLPKNLYDFEDEYSQQSERNQWF